jgi:lipopolysaccharide biosynthesis regulator YciM
MMELLVLLLPVAAISGWMAAKRSYGKGKQFYTSRNIDYFKGLNFLLNEQPDKAIDVFIQMLEVDSETVETHLALGNLFRRRGEVDRAIRIHQNLIARPTLQPEHRAQALLELGQDYMRAGLYDRAESLFQELTESNLHREQALTSLLLIYEKEKEWNKSLQIASKLESITGEQLNDQRAHYYCELADQAHASSDLKLTKEYLKKACECNKDSVRAAILLGEMDKAKGSYKAAIKTFKNIAQNNPVYLSIILPSLRDCFVAIDDKGAFRDFLQQFVKSNQGLTEVIMLSQMIRDEDGAAAAALFLKEHLKENPSLDGLYQLVSLEPKGECITTSEMSQLLRVLLEKLVEDNPGYQCTTCGFSAKTMHWQCPSCNKWSGIHPVQAVV